MAYGVNAPFGLFPIGSLRGGTWSEKLNPYYITCDENGENTLATSILKGDLVIYNTSAAAAPVHGTIQAYAPNVADPANPANVTPSIGVFQKCQYWDANGNFVDSKTWIGGTQVLPGSVITAYIIDDIDVIYSVQIASFTGNNPDEAQYDLLPVGSNAGIGVEGAGNPTIASRLASGVSAQYLAQDYTANSANSATTATMPLKIQGVVTTLGTYVNGAAQQYSTAPTNNFTGFDIPYLNYAVTLNHTVKRAGTAGNPIA